MKQRSRLEVVVRDTAPGVADLSIASRTLHLSDATATQSCSIRGNFAFQRISGVKFGEKGISCTVSGNFKTQNFLIFFFPSDGVFNLLHGKRP